MYEESSERKKYHELLTKFSTMIPKGVMIYDIGVSDNHSYRARFYEYNYKTIDRDASKAPDILVDIETCDLNKCPEADALLCNGVVECCYNPILMITGCSVLLKPGGKALFGMILAGYPVYNNRTFRFEPLEALGALENNGFDIDEVHIVRRNGVASYIYTFCHKVIVNES